MPISLLCLKSNLFHAYFNLGLCYFHGRGVAANPAHAVAVWEAAAEAGEQRALFNLAACHAGGHGVTRDPAKAVEYYRKAAARGDTRARDALAQYLATMEEAEPQTGPSS